MEFCRVYFSRWFFGGFQKEEKEGRRHGKRGGKTCREQGKRIDIHAPVLGSFAFLLLYRILLLKKFKPDGELDFQAMGLCFLGDFALLEVEYPV